MSLFSSIKKKTTLAAATKQISKARKAKDGKAEQLYKSAYEGFEFVLSDNLMVADALYNWGFGLFNQAKISEADTAIELYEEAINKFNFCLTVEPYYLGAAVEGGVAYMDIARLKEATPDDDLYIRAKKCFERAGEIQKGSGAFNLACIYSTENNHEACLAALKDAKENAHLPDEADILNDPDMQNVLKTPWFIEFMGTIESEKEEKIAEAIAKKERKQAKKDAKAGIVREPEKEDKVEAETVAEEVKVTESVEETPKADETVTEDTKAVETVEENEPVAEETDVESSEKDEATEADSEPSTDNESSVENSKPS